VNSELTLAGAVGSGVGSAPTRSDSNDICDVGSDDGLSEANSLGSVGVNVTWYPSFANRDTIGETSLDLCPVSGARPASLRDQARIMSSGICGHGFGE
jgi:hypothetical protein